MGNSLIISVQSPRDTTHIYICPSGAQLFFVIYCVCVRAWCPLASFSRSPWCLCHEQLPCWSLPFSFLFCFIVVFYIFSLRTKEIDNHLHGVIFSLMWYCVCLAKSLRLWNIDKEDNTAGSTPAGQTWYIYSCVCNALSKLFEASKIRSFLSIRLVII